MPTYAKANQIARDILDELLAEHYRELSNHEVTIGMLFAHATTNDAGEKTGPAIKHQGYPAAGLIEVTPLKKRVAGLQDAIITIDGDLWPDWTEQERKALIDHELYHLELLRDPESGDVKTDDHGRPRLKCRLHDWQLGGFQAIAERYENDAIEVQEAVKFKTLYGQYVFEWAEDREPVERVVAAPEKAASKKAARPAKKSRKGAKPAQQTAF